MKPNDKAYEAARYEELIKALRSSSPYTLSHVAADALEAVLAERDAMKDLYAATDWVEKIKGFTSCYEYVPASAVKEDEKFQITLTGAEIRALIDARRKARGE